MLTWRALTWQPPHASHVGLSFLLSPPVAFSRARSFSLLPLPAFVHPPLLRQQQHPLCKLLTCSLARGEVTYKCPSGVGTSDRRTYPPRAAGALKTPRGPGGGHARLPCCSGTRTERRPQVQRAMAKLRTALYGAAATLLPSCSGGRPGRDEAHRCGAGAPAAVRPHAATLPVDAVQVLSPAGRGGGAARTPLSCSSRRAAVGQLHNQANVLCTSDARLGGWQAGAATG